MLQGAGSKRWRQARHCQRTIGEAALASRVVAGGAGGGASDGGDGGRGRPPQGGVLHGSGGPAYRHPSGPFWCRLRQVRSPPPPPPPTRARARPSVARSSPPGPTLAPGGGGGGGDCSGIRSIACISADRVAEQTASHWVSAALAQLRQIRCGRSCGAWTLQDAGICWPAHRRRSDAALLLMTGAA